MKKTCLLSLITVILFSFSCSTDMENKNYKGNIPPLQKNACIKLPLGSVRPEGWLKDQLSAQANGLTGHLDDFWPDLVNSAWRGGPGESWERGPYYLDGLVPLAYILDDENLKEKVREWIEPILSSATDSGWYGPEKNTDRWPLAVANKVLIQYYEATSDNRALDVIKNYFRYIHNSPPDWPDSEWRGVRAMENAVTGYWLYRETKEEWILEAIESIQKNSFDWTSYYEIFPWDSTAAAEKRMPLDWDETGLTAHVVNNAMAIKYPGLWYQQSKDERYKQAVFSGIDKYDLHHGQTGARFSGDEHLSGNSPDRGTELCAVVEYMFSLGELYAIFGDNSLADKLESLAYNALPGTITADIWAHQYDQQSNQVLVTADERAWTSNGEYSNIYGLMPNFACCLANMHQGWPKFVTNLWMATNDNGLIAAAYGPSTVKAKVAGGVEISIHEKTEYPFRGEIKMTISTSESVRFPLYLRIPGWANESSVTYKEKTINPEAGATIGLDEKWKDGDEITIHFPMDIRFERRYNNSVSVLRGPLYYSLRIDKEYKNVKLDYDNFSYMGSIDWEIRPLSQWNYGLVVDNSNPSRGFEINEYPITRYPFADKGDMIWSAYSGKYFIWDQNAPVVIVSRGVEIPEWELKNNSADIPPTNPVINNYYPEVIELVPYGSAKLRISEFPVIEASQVIDVLR